MPIYEFICKECGKQSEVLVKTTDYSHVVCPKCGSKKVEKLISAFSTNNSSETGQTSCPGGSCSLPSSSSCSCCCGGN